jgi:hypothetical protein
LSAQEHAKYGLPFYIPYRKNSFLKLPLFEEAVNVLLSGSFGSSFFLRLPGAVEGRFFELNISSSSPRPSENFTDLRPISESGRVFPLDFLPAELGM